MVGEFGSFEYPLANRFRFECELGRGAMGAVYRAQDLRLRRPVAIKMLHRILTDELGIARFQREVRIAAALRHPNIVSVHEYDEADNRLFYVMDFLEGMTLRERLRRERQLAIADAVAIAAQIAEALQYAHDRGVVHRDVKPENIMLSGGRAWVVDFGVARALGGIDAERLTASGITVGTPHYLSPEQAAAEKNIGPAADQYALACVLFEMLTGEPPFTGPTAVAIAMRHVTEVPPSVQRQRTNVPKRLATAVARGLAKAPENRFADVAGFAAAAEQAIAESTTTAIGISRRALSRVVITAIVLGFAGAVALRCSAL